MKKLVAVLMLVAVILPFGFAQLAPVTPRQSTSASGLFKGKVAGKCLAKTLVQEGDLAEASTGDADFSGQLSGKGKFTFRSNVACTQSTIPGAVSAPSGETAIGACSFDTPSDFSAAQTDTTGKITNVTATITDASGDNVLLAGQYSFTCTATVTSTL